METDAVAKMREFREFYQHFADKTRSIILSDSVISAY